VDGVSVGCDVVEVTRLAGLLARRPGARDRLFTPAEQADAVRDGVAPDDPVAVRRLAARFAAKEAVVKLLGRPRMQWTDVEVATGADGAPHLHLHGRFVPIAVSLSHDGATAMAVVAATSPSPDADGGPPRTSRHGDAPHHPCCGAAAPHGTRPHRPTTRTTTGS
jgi:holo-[acyl-carrier protein] synthase